MKSVGIYVHIPFCESKCPYCDFFSINNVSEYDKYTTTAINRIKQFGLKYDRTVDSIYFGGGTPSAIGTKRLVNILSAIYDSFEVDKKCETTVEVNPNSAIFLDFCKLKEIGFNRLSIGLQSSNQKELTILGRKHTSSEASKIVKIARKSGFNNISLDLMLCVPNQTKSSLAKSIQFCKDCNVEHISAYLLKIEDNTPFYHLKDKLALFDDDQQSEMYTYAVDELRRSGYHQYEISNFCKPGFEGKHNLRYWHDEEYLGIGPSAHSFINGKRFYYDRSMDDFYNDITRDDGTGGSIEEYIMLALRLNEGLDLGNLSKKYDDFVVSDKLESAIKALSINNLISFADNTVRLTTKGFLVSNSVISYIIDSI